MASGNPAMADATASTDLSDRVAQALKPYFAQDQFPGISVAIVTDGQVALRKDTGSATWRPARPSRPTPGSTSVR